MHSEQQLRQPAPVLVIVGGFAGTGKTAVSRRLSTDLSIPRLGSDTIGRTIRNSEGLANCKADAYWIGYDVMFRLCEEFVRAEVAVVLDVTMGWDFQWRAVDGIICRNPQTLFLPVVLRCSKDKCLERIRRRHAADPAHFDAPEVYLTDPKVGAVWQYLAGIDRPDIRFVDAGRPVDEVYVEVAEHVMRQRTHPAAEEEGPSVVLSAKLQRAAGDHGQTTAQAATQTGQIA